MGLASLLTDTPALGLTPRQRRWLGVGTAAAMLFSFQAIFFFFTKFLTRFLTRHHLDTSDWEGEWWLDGLDAALAMFAAAAIALICAVAWERGRGGVLVPLGVALALAGLAWAFAGIVTAEPPPGMRGLEYEAPFRVGWAWTAVALGAPAGCASLIALLGGGRRFPRVAVTALATIVLVALLSGWGWANDSGLERGFQGGALFLNAAGTIVNLSFYTFFGIFFGIFLVVYVWVWVFGTAAIMGLALLVHGLGGAFRSP